MPPSKPRLFSIDVLAAAHNDPAVGLVDPFETLLEVLESPYDEKEGLEAYASPAPPSFGRYRTFCGT